MANFSSNDLNFLLPGAGKERSKDDETRQREIRSRQAQKDALSKSNPLSKRKAQRSSKQIVYRRGKAPNKQSDTSTLHSNQTQHSKHVAALSTLDQAVAKYEEATVLSSSGESSSEEDEDDEDILIAVPEQMPAINTMRTSTAPVQNNARTYNNSSSSNINTNTNTNNDDSSSSDDEEDNAAFQRRQQLKKKMLKPNQTQSQSNSLPPQTTVPPKSQTFQAPLPTQKHRTRAPSNSSSSSGSDSGSSYESDSDSDPDYQTKKPIFVPKSKRNASTTNSTTSSTTNHSNDAAIQQQHMETKRFQREARREQEQLEQTQQFLSNTKSEPVTSILQEELLDDSDGIDDAKEFAEWRQREFLRIHIHETSTMGSTVSRERKKMTDAQVKAENAKIGKNVERDVQKQRMRKQQQYKNSKLEDSEVKGAKFVHRGAFG